MNIVPFDPAHLTALRLQPAQVSTPLIPAGMEAGEAYTALVDGEPIACAGLFELWPNRALAWAYVGANAGRHFVGVTRAVRKALDQSRWQRVEAYVAPNFWAGHRWMLILGFRLEGVLRAFQPDGSDMALYARVA